jgi:hypothetical protein
MKEIATVHLELLAAEIAVGAQKEVIPKNTIFRRGQRSFGYQEEVGEIFLAFAGEDAASAGTIAGLPRD